MKFDTAKQLKNREYGYTESIKVLKNSICLLQ